MNERIFHFFNLIFFNVTKIQGIVREWTYFFYVDLLQKLRKSYELFVNERILHF